MAIINPGGGGGNTNLSITTRTATNLTVASSTGSGAVVPVATDLLAGLLNATDKKKLDGIKQTCLSLTYTFTAAGSQIADDGATGALGDLAKVGQLIVITGTVSNDGIYTVASIVDADTITVVEALVNEAGIAAEICATTVGEGNTFTAAATAPLSPSYGDLWWDTVDEVLAVWINDGTSDLWLGISGGAGSPIANWVTGTEYIIGQVVFEENRIYRANTAHTAGVFDTDRANWTVLVTIPAGSSWAASTYYYADDLVVENNILYKRIADGTSGATFDPTEEALWNALGSTGVIANWTTGTYYEIGEVVLNAGTIYRTTTAHTAGATFDAAEAGNFEVIANYTELEAWAATTYYPAGKLLTQGTRIIERTADGTSGASFDSTEAALWTPVKLMDTTAWQASTFYYTGETATYAGTLLSKIVDGDSTAQFDAVEDALWTVLNKTLRTWVTGTYYRISDIVITQTTGDVVVCVIPGIASASFDTDIAKWNPLVTSGDAQAWVALRAYYQGDLSTQGNRVLRRNSTGTSAGSFTNAEAAFWELLSQNDVSNWVANTYYYAGETVYNNGVQYRRQTAGISTAQFDATEALNWDEVGTVGTPFVKTITDADSPYTVVNLDNSIFIDSSAGAVDYVLDISLPEGKFFNITYIQTANAITVAASGGATVMDPTTYLQVASFVLPGAIGQNGSTAFYRVGNEFYFQG